MIYKDEAGLKADFVKLCRARLHGAVVFRHEDVRTAGIPDISITFNGTTSWWEAKHATPRFLTSGIQELTLTRLAMHGYARYLIWYETEKSDQRRTLIVHPTQLAEYKNVHEEAFNKFNSDELFDHIRKVHHA